MTTLAVEDIKKNFGPTEVLKDIDMEIGTGDFLVLVGPSGCGKSTLLNIIAGLEKETSGRVVIAGKDVAHLEPKERDIAMVFQSYALYPSMTVARNIGFSLEMAGVDKAKRMERINEVAELLKITDLLNRRPSQLSGGQRQRVAMGRALVREPQVFLFDEPLSNLDAKLRRQVREDIRAIQKDLGLTVVYVTHDQEEALAVSDQIVVMRNAAIAQIGTPRDLYEAPKDRFVADFIGEANLIACQIVAVEGDMATIDIEGYRHTLPSRGLSAGPATLAVRPSRLRIGDDEGIPATIAKATYVGERMEYTLEGGFGQVFAVQDEVDEPLLVGRAVRMSFAGKGPVLLPES